MPGATPRAADGADLRELVAILSRRRRSILLAAMLTTAFGAAYVLATPKVYTATVSILVDARSRAPLGTEQTTANTSQVDVALVESQVRLIASDAILRRVVEREHLADDPAYAAATPGLLARLTGLGATGLNGPDEKAARALGSLRRNVTAKRSERTYFMDVDVTAADGATAARLADAVASAYIADQADTKAQAAQQDGAVLKIHLEDLQKRLALAESKVQAYKAEHQIFDVNGKRVNEQDLADAATALTAAHTKTIDAKARFDQIQRLLASGRGVDAAGEALKSPVIDRLRSEYTAIARQEANYRTTLGDKHPALVETVNQAREIRNLINEELKRVSAGAANEYQAARDSEAAASRRVETLKAGANVTSKDSVELRKLEQDVDASKSVYDKYLRSRETIGENGLDGPSARVIAPATVPTGASAPKTLPILALSLAGGLFLGIGQAFFAEYMAQGAPVPERAPVREKVPLAPVVAIPRARSLGGWFRRRKATKPVAADPANPPAKVTAVAEPPKPARQASGAVQALWAELLLDFPAADRRAPLTIMVTSLDRQCGKTLSAIDLARAAAQSGESVLLIDADRANPALAASLDLPPRAVILDLSGTPRPCYHLEGPEDVSVVPILADEEALVRRLLRQGDRGRIGGIAGNFTCVVLDGGTIDEGGEASGIAEAADRVVLVTRQARLSRFQISRAMRTLDLADDRFGGAFCNGQASSVAA